ncbi:MAG TPA: amidohydrolase family protein [Terriglobales bacterium]|nr:amidohydrolase family protein [Terriglobales bacterium]
MLTESDLALPMIDHHCHGVSPAELDFAGFQAMFSESYRPAPAGTTEFQKPLGLAIRRWCAPVLDLEPSCPAEAYVERRLALGAAEVNKRFLQASGLDELLIDTGHRSAAIANVEQMGTIANRPAREIVRIEAVAEEVARSGISAAGFVRAFAEKLAERAKSAVGLKTIVAYRTTFKIDQTAPAAADVDRAADAWFKRCADSGKVRLEDPTIIRHGLWIGAELCRKHRFPMQVHVGFGDPDVYMHACDPTHFTDFIAAMEKWEVPITLLHNYPFQREAAWLSEIFQNVYYDVGVILNYAAPMATDILGEAMEMGKYSKLLYSSDAFGLSELYYLGARQFRLALRRVLDRWLAEDACSLQDAEEIIQMLAQDNARRIYPLS